MTLSESQVQRIHKNIEKHLAEVTDLRWTIEFHERQWLVKGSAGNLICQFPEVPKQVDLESMVHWGTATAPENMGSLWRSQLEYLANVAIPESFEEVRDREYQQQCQSQQSQQ